MFFSLHFVLLSVAVAHSTSAEDCVRSNGAGYRGAQQRASSGQTCLNWMNSTRDYDTTLFTDSQTGVGDHSSCRNPDSATRPWCYVSAGPDGATQRQDCAIDACKDQPSDTPAVKAEAPPTETPPPRETTTQTRASAPGKAAPGQGGGAAVQPIMGISQRVRTGPKQKKDLGTLGYVLAALMMSLIILAGVGITLGYFFKRGRDLKKQHEQRVYEREMQRITLPLSAFSNPGCQLLDETAVVIEAGEQTPVQEGALEEGGDPLMGQPAGTPGA